MGLLCRGLLCEVTAQSSEPHVPRFSLDVREYSKLGEIVYNLVMGIHCIRLYITADASCCNIYVKLVLVLVKLVFTLLRRFIYKRI